jgi:hypothetical protein
MLRLRASELAVPLAVPCGAGGPLALALAALQWQPGSLSGLRLAVTGRPG